MLTVGVIGATGYAGAELMRLLCHHPHVKKIIAGSHSYVDQPYSTIYPNFQKIFDAPCIESDVLYFSQRCDILFVSLPHAIASKHITQSILEQSVVIDLGPDFRLSDASVYETWYRTTHYGEKLLQKSVYGLSEIYRQQIKGTRLVANPGCYTTCSILSAAPLFSHTLIEFDSLIIDAKSGVSGAGRSEKLGSLYCECNESIKPYGVATHRHTPEIEEQLSRIAFAGTRKDGIVISFTPHLVPMNRGILSTLYATLRAGVTLDDVHEAYQTMYGKEKFIRIMKEGMFPETRYVKGSNYCDIGYTIDPRTNRIIVCGAIDNLIKGAAGQAVQNMNIMYGYEESCGIDAIAAAPW